MPKSKTQLNTDVASRFPTQSSGLITAADLRYICTGVIEAIPNYSTSGGYIRIDPIANTGSIELTSGVIVWDTGVQKLYFWASTGFREIKFV